jgi:hypothetical protein
MLRSSAAALATALLYAFGTLAWPYSGTLFGEPLALLLVLLSFHLIVALDRGFDDHDGPRAPLLMALSGLALGLASATHLTALLFLPFFLLYSRFASRGARRRGETICWVLGAALPLAALGWYNLVRFGSLLESGRALSGLNPVLFHHPLAIEFWRGLFGLLAGGGKGLLLFSPAVLLGALGWRAMARRSMPLTLILGAALFSRLFFAASYYDWHGGFCLGPRYLLLAVPFLILPLGFWLDERLERRDLKTLVLGGLAAWAAMTQQLYFSLGDVFRYYHEIKIDYLGRGIDLFLEDRIYLEWALSPLIHSLDYPAGAFLLRTAPLPTAALWGGGSLLLLIALSAVGYRLRFGRP